MTPAPPVSPNANTATASSSAPVFAAVAVAVAVTPDPLGPLLTEPSVDSTTLEVVSSAALNVSVNTASCAAFRLPPAANVTVNTDPDGIRVVAWAV
jgi:hypothetical protein